MVSTATWWRPALQESLAIDCDVSTPLVWVGPDATAVDLFLDVLVRVDTSYRVVDRREFEAACSWRLIFPSEAHHAEQGLTQLLHWITSGRLHELLARIPPTVAARALATAVLPFASRQGARGRAATASELVTSDTSMTALQQRRARFADPHLQPALQGLGAACSGTRPSPQR
ncbi:DUF402 domain-containing protein [Occultella aeris]|uniref:DUF402 domain-containing protein n=1 Tax=Occultella aeris TaxID=2761496 RepID=UPI0038CD97E8